MSNFVVSDSKISSYPTTAPDSQTRATNQQNRVPSSDNEQPRRAIVLEETSSWTTALWTVPAVASL